MLTTSLATNEFTKYKARLNLHSESKSMEWIILIPMLLSFWSAVCLMLIFDIWYCQWLGNAPSGFCHGISTSTNWDGHVHGPTSWNPHYTWRFKGLLPNVAQQSVWTEAGWQSMESISHWQVAQHRIHTVASGWMRILPWRGHLHRICCDGMFVGKNDQLISAAIKELKALDLNLEDQGHPAD